MKIFCCILVLIIKNFFFIADTKSFSGAESSFNYSFITTMYDNLSFVNKSIMASVAAVLPSERTENANEMERLQLETDDTEMIPVAVPVLTPEEADAANQEAIPLSNNQETPQKKKPQKEKKISFLDKIQLTASSFSLLIALLPLLFIADVLFAWKKKKDSGRKGILGNMFVLQRRVYVLLSVYLVVFGLSAFVPWSVYCGNSGQFPFIFADFMSGNLITLALAVMIGFVILLAIPPKVGDFIVAAVAGLGLCIYSQSMFMNLFLGSMDGAEPDWGEHLVWGIVNILIWVVVMLLPVLTKIFFRAQGRTIISFAVGIVLILELTASISMLLSSSDSIWKRKMKPFFSGADEFQLSKEKNIVVFILDQVGSGLVIPCFEADPESKEALKDFTWYRNALSCYAMTYPSVLSILTGSYISPAKDQMTLFEQAWSYPTTKAFYSQIKKAGYDSRLFMQSAETIGPVGFMMDYFSNITNEEIDYRINHQKLRSCLIQISGFSSAPYLLKRYFYYADDFHQGVVTEKTKVGRKTGDLSLPNRNDTFYKKMIRVGITANSTQPVLAFYYTRGAHVTWNVDEKCKPLSPPSNSILPPARGSFFLVSEYIRLLKENGIYDQTAIIVCSDHGARVKEYTKTPQDMTLMIKPFNTSNDSIVIDDKKALALDILPSILHLIDPDHADLEPFAGFPVKDIPPDRKRVVYQRKQHPNLPSFMGIDGNLMQYNSEYEIIVDENNERKFSRYMPWNNEVKVDEKHLINYRTEKD